MDNDKSIDTNKCSSLHISREDFDKIIEHSNDSLIDAYSRMDMFNQPWTKHTPKEIDYIVPYIPSKDSVIIDVGCGTARHLAELYNRGYHNVFGYDFSSNLIEQAKEKFPYLSNSLFVSDCRNLCVNKKADVILCLYDVIGSFAKEEENIRIIKQIKKNTNKNAIVISSVMNFELTNHMAKHKFDVYANPEKLIKMASSLTMQKSGNVFNPDFYVIHKNSHIVFRKEMFKSDGYLDSEYIVRDRRYTKEQISKIFSKQGFNVLDSRYVQAGNWDKPLSNIDPKAKEILLVLKKE